MWEVVTAALKQAQLAVWAARAACPLFPERATGGRTAQT